MKIVTFLQLPVSNNNVYRPYNKDTFSIYDYVGVYGDKFDTEISDIEICERLFTKFNTEFVEHFCGHSMSVSDVVYITDESGIARAYYCQPNGWELLKLEEE